jgi:hypothetical protein
MLLKYYVAMLYEVITIHVSQLQSFRLLSHTLSLSNSRLQKTIYILKI